MHLFCTTCKQQRPHTNRIKTSGYENSASKVCKYCATLNTDPNWRFKPKGIYGVPVYSTSDAAIRQYRARGVKHPERLFPNWTGETALTLDAFLTQMIAESWHQGHFLVDTPSQCKRATLIWLGDFSQMDWPEGRLVIFPPNCKHYGQTFEVPYNPRHPDDGLRQVCALLDHQGPSPEITGIITGHQY